MNHLLYRSLALSFAISLISAENNTTNGVQKETNEYIDKDRQILYLKGKKWNELDRMLIDPNVQLNRDEIFNVLEALSDALKESDLTMRSSLTDSLKEMTRKINKFYEFKSEFCTVEHFKDIRELYIKSKASHYKKIRGFLKSIEDQHFHKCSSLFTDKLQQVVSSLSAKDKKNVERLHEIGNFEGVEDHLASDFLFNPDSIHESVLNFLEAKHGRLYRKRFFSKYLGGHYIHGKVKEVFRLCARINEAIDPVIAVFYQLSHQQSLSEFELYWIRVFNICKSINGPPSFVIRGGIVRLLNNRLERKS